VFTKSVVQQANYFDFDCLASVIRTGESLAGGKEHYWLGYSVRNTIDEAPGT
jgi:hypothetical protein